MQAGNCTSTPCAVHYTAAQEHRTAPASTADLGHFDMPVTVQIYTVPTGGNVTKTQIFCTYYYMFVRTVSLKEHALGSFFMGLFSLFPLFRKPHQKHLKPSSEETGKPFLFHIFIWVLKCQLGTGFLCRPKRGEGHYFGQRTSCNKVTPIGKSCFSS